MRRLIQIAILGLCSFSNGIVVATPESPMQPIFTAPQQSGLDQFDEKRKDRLEVAVLCFLQGESVSGFNKICFYDCLGSQAAITIGSTELCPLNINR